MKYPFSPEMLDAMPERLAALYRALELTLLKNIADRLKAAGKLNEVTVQNIRALRSHGIPLDEIRKALKDTAGLTDKEVDTLFADVVSRNEAYAGYLSDMAQITEPDMLVDAATIDAVIRQTKGEIRNLTQSMGFLVDAGKTMLPPAKAYEWALDKAVTEIQSGAISYNQAIADATRELADSGLMVVDYESGHHDHVDVAVRRAAMTGVTQICDQYTDQSMDYIDTRYVEVSAHAGARDKDYPNPWSSHKAWQGRVYYQSENGEPDPLGKYKDLAKTTGYGEVDGLCGANCRHRRSPFIPGVMEPTYTEEQLANIDPPDFEFEGKRYTHYEATQEQRRIERTIRKWKRREAAAVTEEDKLATQTRIRRLREGYVEFSKKAGLRTQIERANLYQPKIKNVVDISEKRDTISMAGYMEQESGLDAEIPDEFKGNFDDYAELDLTGEEATALRSLNNLALKTGHEYGTAIIGGEATEAYTSDLVGMVYVPEEYRATPGVKLFHSHTNCTPPSYGDLRHLTNPNVAQIGVISINGDVYTAEVGSGQRVTLEEFDKTVAQEFGNFNDEMAVELALSGYTPAQMNYVVTREQFYRMARLFEWTIRGGRI